MTETRRRATSRGAASPGMPRVPEGDEGDRLVELEARLARLEEAPGLRQRSRTLVDHVVPNEARRHFRNAGREHLLGVRSIVDFWIDRIDAMEAPGGSDTAMDRERIEID